MTTLVARAAEPYVQAIRLCLEHKLSAQALILIFSTIDFLSSLDRPAGKPEAQRSDFIAWIDRYMPCGGGRGLYAARCTIVHCAPSRLEREGTVKRALCDGATLLAALCDGVKAYGEAVEADPERAALVRRRLA